MRSMPGHIFLCIFIWEYLSNRTATYTGLDRPVQCSVSTHICHTLFGQVLYEGCGKKKEG